MPTGRKAGWDEGAGQGRRVLGPGWVARSRLGVGGVCSGSAETLSSLILSAADIEPGALVVAGEIARVRSAVKSPPPVSGAVVEMVRCSERPPRCENRCRRPPYRMTTPQKSRRAAETEVRSSGAVVGKSAPDFRSEHVAAAHGNRGALDRGVGSVPAVDLERSTSREPVGRQNAARDLGRGVVVDRGVASQ